MNTPTTISAPRGRTVPACRRDDVAGQLSVTLILPQDGWRPLDPGCPEIEALMMPKAWEIAAMTGGAR